MARRSPASPLSSTLAGSERCEGVIEAALWRPPDLVVVASCGISPPPGEFVSAIDVIPSIVRLVGAARGRRCPATGRGASVPRAACAYTGTGRRLSRKRLPRVGDPREPGPVRWPDREQSPPFAPVPGPVAGESPASAGRDAGRATLTANVCAVLGGAASVTPCDVASPGHVATPARTDLGRDAERMWRRDT